MQWHLGEPRREIRTKTSSEEASQDRRMLFSNNGHAGYTPKQKGQAGMKDIAPENGDIGGDAEGDVGEGEGVSEVDAGDSVGEPEPNNNGWFKMVTNPAANDELSAYHD